MIISMIAAMDENFLIGNKGKLPWPNLPQDMKRFRDLTVGKPVVMGQKTFRSIGKPLQNRANIVLSRDKNLNIPGCLVMHSVDEVLKQTKYLPETMIIGGESIYRQFAPIADYLYLTFIREHFEEGDTYFPITDFGEWEENDEEQIRFPADEKNPYDLLFQSFERKQPK